MNLEVGQVLWLYIRYDNKATIADHYHPYVIVDLREEANEIEVVQLDKLAGKEYMAMHKNVKTILNKDPFEKIIKMDSYAKLDTTIVLEYYDEIIKYRKNEYKLSEIKLRELIRRYNLYHENYDIDDNKNVYITAGELEMINNDPSWR